MVQSYYIAAFLRSVVLWGGIFALLTIQLGPWEIPEWQIWKTIITVFTGLPDSDVEPRGDGKS